MFPEDDLLPLSALQHLVFCPRQCGLIHLEQVWAENRLTAEGRVLHEKTHEPQTENRPGVRIVRSLRLHSYRLGLAGVADVVEFHQNDTGIRLPGATGLWRPMPVEYKRGKPKSDSCDEVQLCAQAMCLEEMLATIIDEGALFYGQPRRRQAVVFSPSLRQTTEQAANDLHQLFQSGRTPQARYQKKCDSCSLFRYCMPKTTGVAKKIDLYLAKAYEPPSEMTEP